MNTTKTRKVNRMAALELKAALEAACETGNATKVGDGYVAHSVHTKNLLSRLETLQPGHVAPAVTPAVAQSLDDTARRRNFLHSAVAAVGGSITPPAYSRSRNYTQMRASGRSHNHN